MLQSDGGAHLVCALNLGSESTAGAHEVRPYGRPFGFATYEWESHSTASFRMRILSRAAWAIGSWSGLPALNSRLTAASSRVAPRRRT